MTARQAPQAALSPILLDAESPSLALQGCPTCISFSTMWFYVCKDAKGKCLVSWLRGIIANTSACFKVPRALGVGGGVSTDASRGSTKTHNPVTLVLGYFLEISLRGEGERRRYLTAVAWRFGELGITNSKKRMQNNSKVALPIKQIISHLMSDPCTAISRPAHEISMSIIFKKKSKTQKLPVNSKRSVFLFALHRNEGKHGNEAFDKFREVGKYA